MVFFVKLFFYKMRLATFFWIAEDYMLPCLTKKFLGFDCPGCGLQRSVAFLLQGDFVASFEMYPALFPMILLFLFLGIKSFIQIKFENMITYILLLITFITIMTNFLIKLI